MTMGMFIFGAGYTGRAIARDPLGKVQWVAGTTRSSANFEALRLSGVTPHLYSGTGFAPETASALQKTTHLIVSTPPDEDGDPVLSDIVAVGAKALPALQWIGYLSTVGVYGDHSGAWVDETSECRPVSQRSRWRLEAEQRWISFARGAGIPLAVFRLAGIYGPGRNAFVNLANATAKRIVKPGQVFNRVYVDDIAGAVATLMRAKAAGIFNLSDDEPTAPQDVVSYAAALMQVRPPPEIPFAQAQMTPMSRSFYSECKRVSNAKLKAAGYRLQYPSYRDGLMQMWRSGEWKTAL